ncbi:MAG: thioesterase family protein [Pseudomonadota bacterium]
MLMTLRKSGWKNRVRDGAGNLSQTLKMTVWPTDMDIFMHMTNTRYFDVMKISAHILFARIGLEDSLKRENLQTKQIYSDLDVYAMLRLLQTYTLHTEIVGGEDGALAVSHTFKRGKKTNGRGLVLYSVKDARAPDKAVSQEQYLPGPTPPLPDDSKDWMSRQRLNPPL